MMYVNKEFFDKNMVQAYGVRHDDSDILVDNIFHEGEGDGITLRLSRNANSGVDLIVRHYYTNHVAARAKKYPPIGDQLDALWKLIQANADKIDLVEAAPLLEAVKAVKDKYPKPS